MKNLPIFIDFEASSLHLEKSFPVEVAIAMPDESVHTWIIKTHPIWNDPTTGDACGIDFHGIAPNVIENGVNIKEVCKNLNKYLAGKYVYSDAVKMDNLWCKTLFESEGITCDFNLSDASILFDDYLQPQANAYLQTYLSNEKITHRASDDVKKLQKLYQLYQSWKV